MGFLDDYQPVDERLHQFWSDHPGGRIVTDMMDAPPGEFIFVAAVWRSSFLPLSVQDDSQELWEAEPNPDPDATGWAREVIDSLPANMKGSALETCETSAVGRALANLGYAPKGKRPSREEMVSATAVAEPSAPPAGAHTEAPAEHGTTATPVVAEGESSRVGEGRPSTWGQSSGGGSDVYGEGAKDSPSDAPSDRRRTPDEIRAPSPLVALLEAVGGSEVKAINAVNRAVGGGYRKEDLETLTPDEWAAGLAGVTMR